MTLIRENLLPTLIILVAGLLVSFAALPLANTEFAQGMRGGATTENADAQPATEEQAALGGLLLLLPLVKVAAFMGVGAGLTAFGLWIIRKIKGRGLAREKVSVEE